ncbi:hypothetical protein UFOVP130_18 [uncultured Caudovirales phage]|uniref:Uncharacterized protein n=1 Tax=uncultured Caudovirales phage TaxID=2100421 RepID=A0A6J5L9A7_9CAUD|nr:hypothetical protein UFOVP130_18 [uncultured Caudovirales phage]
MSKPWEKSKSESTKAYAAFCAYRDLGPGRSIEKAFAVLKPDKKRNGRPAEWYGWSVKFEWVKRVEAWDEFAEEFQRREFEARLKKLAHDQADFAVEEFARLVKRVRRADRLLDKADELPLTDVEEEQGGKKTRVRGVDMARYAALMKEIRESARRAIIGPRDDAEQTAPANPATEIEWEKPLDRDA